MTQVKEPEFYGPFLAEWIMSSSPSYPVRTETKLHAIRLILAGLSSGTVAQEAGISRTTVRTWRCNIKDYGITRSSNQDHAAVALDEQEEPLASEMPADQLPNFLERFLNGDSPQAGDNQVFDDFDFDELDDDGSLDALFPEMEELDATDPLAAFDVFPTQVPSRDGVLAFPDSVRQRISDTYGDLAPEWLVPETTVAVLSALDHEIDASRVATIFDLPLAEVLRLQRKAEREDILPPAIRSDPAASGLSDPFAGTPESSITVRARSVTCLDIRLGQGDTSDIGQSAAGIALGATLARLSSTERMIHVGLGWRAYRKDTVDLVVKTIAEAVAPRGVTIVLALPDMEIVFRP